jgi:hypothetical protein
VAVWATIADVESWLGIPQDQRMNDALAVSQAWCERQRPDLITDAAYTSEITYDGVDVRADTVGADVTHAVVLYAALLYRERTSPQGFSAYDGIDSQAFQDQSAMMNIYRLLGTRRPVAR